MVHPGIHFKAVEGDTLAADTEFGQGGAYLLVKAVAVHTQVGRGIAESDQAGLYLHRLSAYVNCSNLGSDMAQFSTDGQPGPLIGLLLCRSQCLFGGSARMRRGPAGKLLVTLLGIGMAQAVHF